MLDIFVTTWLKIFCTLKHNARWHMDLKENIEFIIDWIEENKHYPLRIEDVVVKSGYSRWYLQRVFLKHTGVTLATYCRRRRLTLAALAVKYSAMSLAEVASWFGYDSQQTFNKEFSRYFGTTPGKIRKSHEIKWSIIYPTLADQYFPDEKGPVLSSAPVKALCGTNHSYTLEPSQLDRHPVQHRKKLWDDFLTLLPVRPQKIYCLTGPCPEKSNGFIVNYRYFPSVCHQTQLPDYFDCLSLNEMSSKILYASFSYSGHFTGIEPFIRNIYNRQLTKAKLNRIDGDDIEEFELNGRSTFGDEDGNVKMVYYVPVSY